MPLPAQHALDADVGAVLRAQELPQLELFVGARREVGVAGLGRQRAIARAVGDEHRFAEAGARRDRHAIVACGTAAPGCSTANASAGSDEHAERGRLQIVEQRDRARRASRRALLASIVHGRFVIFATPSTTGPATPIVRRLDALAAEELVEDRSSELKSAQWKICVANDRRRGRRRGRAASWCRRVSSQDHAPPPCGRCVDEPPHVGAASL